MKKFYLIIGFFCLGIALALDVKPFLLVSAIFFVVAFMQTVRDAKVTPGEGVAGDGVTYNGKEHNYESGSVSFGDSDGGGDGGGD